MPPCLPISSDPEEGLLSMPLMDHLTELRSRLISSLPSFGSPGTSIRRGLQSIANVAFAQLLQELLRRNEERILLQHAAEDHHRMSS